MNQFKIHSESVAYRKASWSLKTRRLRWTQISALITVIICGSGNIFWFLSRSTWVSEVVYLGYWFSDFVFFTHHLLWMVKWTLCEHIYSQQETDFYQIFKSNHQSRTISWILIWFWDRQIENFPKIRMLIEPDRTRSDLIFMLKSHIRHFYRVPEIFRTKS